MEDIKEYYKNMEEFAEKREYLEIIKKEREVLKVLMKRVDKMIEEVEIELAKEEEKLD